MHEVDCPICRERLRREHPRESAMALALILMPLLIVIYGAAF